MKMNKIETIVAEFAKANKISREKAKNFALHVAEVVAPSAGGRKPLSGTIEYRKKVEDAVVSGRLGKTFTTADLVGVVGGDLTAANNTLRYLKEHKQLVAQAGLKQKEQGHKGRRQVIWSV